MQILVLTCVLDIVMTQLINKMLPQVGQSLVLANKNAIRQDLIYLEITLLTFVFQLLNAQIILMVITSPRFVKLNVQILPIMEIIKLIYVQLHVLLVLNKMIPKPVLEHVQPIIVLVINNSVIQSLYFVKTTALEITMLIIKPIGNVF